MLDHKVIDLYRSVKQKEEAKFGVEVEIEGERLPAAITGWGLREEHSLRGPENREFAFDRPVGFKGTKDRLVALNDALKANNANVTTSYRGSTHIHYNVQQDTVRTVLNEWVLFTAIEPVFLTIAGGNRDGNLFCLPGYDVGDAVSSFFRQLSTFARGGATWHDRGKYSARNSDPLRRQGSVEYRFFPPTTDTETILKWCQYIDNLWNLAREYTDPNVLHKAVLDYRSNPGLFLRVFPTEDLPSAFKELAEQGAQLSYELSRKYVMMCNEMQEKTTQPKTIKSEVPPTWDAENNQWVDNPAPEDFVVIEPIGPPVMPPERVTLERFARIQANLRQPDPAPGLARPWRRP